MTNDLHPSMRTTSAVTALLAQTLCADPQFGPVLNTATALTAYAQHVLRCAYRAGSVDVVRSRETPGRRGATRVVGVAVTMPHPCDQPLPGLDALPELGALAGELARLDERRQSRRPSCGPYQVLEHLAVDPDVSYVTVGSDLLRRLRKRFNAMGVSCYTEASNVRASELLRRCGFVTLPIADGGQRYPVRKWCDPVEYRTRVYSTKTFLHVDELFRQQGRSARDIAAEVGCSTAAVYYMLDTLGVGPDSRIGMPDDAAQRYQDGETTAEDIAVAAGIQIDRVLTRLAEAGAQIPADHEQRVRKDIIYRYTQRHQSMRTIAAAVRRSYGYVHTTIADAGVPRRPRGGTKGSTRSTP